MTIYPTLAARHEAVREAQERRRNAFAALQTAVNTADHAAVRTANAVLEHAQGAYVLLLQEEWRLEGAQ